MASTIYGGNQRETDLPLIVVNSHGHPDHVCGNFRFTGDIYIMRRIWMAADGLAISITGRSSERSQTDGRLFHEGASKYPAEEF
jgi:glyoxylase-like metal-dependent hydrolase (beta-lactamase superfamily II)